MNNVCKIENCENKAPSGGMCSRHYTEKRFAGITCSVSGCERGAARSGNRCVPHYTEWLYSPKGQAEKIVQKVSDKFDYSNAHRRVLAARGPAKMYWCVDCDGRASEWSLKVGASDIQYGTNVYKSGSAYSMNVEDYEARCAPCHRAHDAKHPGLRKSGYKAGFKTTFRPETRGKAEEATRLVKTGMTIVQVSEAIGCSTASVSIYFLGIEGKSIREWKAEQKAGAAR